jgi:hypothetical protein
MCKAYSNFFSGIQSKAAQTEHRCKVDFFTPTNSEKEIRIAKQKKP